MSDLKGGVFQMRSSVVAGMAIACTLSTSASAALTTTGTFSRWFGDVGDPAVWEVYVNDIAVPNNLPDVDGFPQGELIFTDPQPSAVEFKDRQVGFSDFNAASLIEFTGTSQPNPGSIADEFKLGTITLTNGIFFFQAAVDITVATASDNPAFDGKSFTDTLRYIVTPNTGTDEENADYAYFVGRPELGQIRVYEAVSAFPNTGSIELWGKVGSLTPTAFRNASGGVFLQPVPEPSTYAMLGVGLALLAVAARAGALGGRSPEPSRA